MPVDDELKHRIAVMKTAGGKPVKVKDELFMVFVDYRLPGCKLCYSFTTRRIKDVLTRQVANAVASNPFGAILLLSEVIKDLEQKIKSVM